MSERLATVERLKKGALRYRAVAAAVAAAGVIVALSPGVEGTGSDLLATDDVGGSTSATLLPVPTTAGGALTPGGPGVATTAPRGGAGPGSPATGGGAAVLPANCDPATGRIKFPSSFAPPCVAKAKSAGATSSGVTADEIKVVLYRAQPDPTVDALLKAAGATDSREDVLATYHDWFQLFNAHYETYGRRVQLSTIEASGDSTDDAAARADAIRVATEMKPFIVIGGPSPFVDELAQRGIIVITQLQRPNEYYADRAPYVWGSQMSSTQAFTHLGEYIGKRLKGQNAVHAGDASIQSQPRKFGLIYLDTAEGVYRPGVDALERELGKYGVGLTDKVSYISDINRAQEQARVIIARLKEKGVTTVLFSGDPIAPIFMTQEATQQEWHPEWVMPGGTLVDTSFFGRTYDQSQWGNAFGISQLSIRGPFGTSEPYRVHNWHYGRNPTAKATPEIQYQEPLIIFTGIHMAGPTLNPRTFRDGLFNWPVSGAGKLTEIQRSFGRKGIWPFDDYSSFDTVTEVWWDPEAEGIDEIGHQGTGLLQYVNGGKRYGPGEWPTTTPAVFDRSQSRTSYDAIPPGDLPPDYPKPS